MTTIENVYFHDEEYSAKKMLNTLFEKKRIKKIDVIDIIKGW